MSIRKTQQPNRHRSSKKLSTRRSTVRVNRLLNQGYQVLLVPDLEKREVKVYKKKN